MKEAAPRATRIGVLGHGSNPTFVIYRRELEPAAVALRLRLEFREMVRAVDIESDVAGLTRTGVGAVLVMHQPFTFVNRGPLRPSDLPGWF